MEKERSLSFAACLGLVVAYGCGGSSESQGGSAAAGGSAGASGSSGTGSGAAGKGGSGAAGKGGTGGAGGSAGSGASTGGAGGAVGGSGGTSGAGGSGGTAGEGGAFGAGDGGTSSGSGGAAGGGGSAGSPGDQCASDEECVPAGCAATPCEAFCTLGTNGYRECRTRPSYPPGSCENAPAEECCETKDDCQEMAGGQCVPLSHGWCGGPVPLPQSFCRYDACTSDADCTESDHGFCLVDAARSCAYGPCSTNADCTQGTGGLCVITLAGQFCAQLRVSCLYDDDPCKADADCRSDGGNDVCEPDMDGHGRHCEPYQPPPP